MKAFKSFLDYFRAVMFTICKKELRQFFSGLLGYLVIMLFLVISSLLLFVFPDTSMLEYGYSSLEQFFTLAPFIFLFFIPAITMRSFSEEFRSGTYEILLTRPLSLNAVIGGKALGAFFIAVIALLPTAIYPITIQILSLNEGLDVGALTGSYLGLLLLIGVYVSIGIFSSSLSANPVLAFVLGAFFCFVLFMGFSALSKVQAFEAGADYYIELFGLEYHYKNISRGVVDTRDVLFFISIALLFLYFTKYYLLKRSDLRNA